MITLMMKTVMMHDDSYDDMTVMIMTMTVMMNVDSYDDDDSDSDHDDER